MSDSVLGLIDGAIADYGTDAMRWSPEPEKAAPLPAIDREAVAMAVAELNAVLRRTIANLFEAMRPTFDAFRASMERFAKDLGPFLEEVEDTRRARLRRMHAMYRARRR